MTDDYKHKYEELMQRCEEFNIWFEEHKKKMGVRIIPTQPLGPAKTMDIMWPDRIPTTLPFPQHYYDPWNDVCLTCRLSMTNKSNYVCNIPNCPKNSTATSNTGENK